ncbi:MAG: hypothetical protein LBM02_03730 [Lachnospiraceae bacterium]|jgi:hypothetical protein|nr:hypothetical protein [Lachnospiraceae bacterium]
MVIVKLKNLLKEEDSFHAYRGRSIETIVRRVFGETAYIRDLPEKNQKFVYKKINTFIKKVAVISSETEDVGFRFPHNMDNLENLLFDFKEHTCKYCSNYDRSKKECEVANENVSKCLCKNGVSKFLSTVR